MKRILFTLVILPLCFTDSGLRAQNFPTDDPVIRSIWAEASDSSQLTVLAHELLDVIGPRLVGSPQMMKAHEWAVARFMAWGVEGRNEEWGKWRGWERGITHIDLLEPRVRSLEGTMLAWSPGTKKGGVKARVIILEEPADSLAFRQWLKNVKGKFVMVSNPEPTGRPDKNWEEFAVKADFDSMKASRERLRLQWAEGLKRTGFRQDTLVNIFEEAGAAGVLTSGWSGGWGTTRIFGTKARKIPMVDLSLEDYNLVFRLARSGNDPLVRIIAESETLEEMPAMNTIGRIRGTEKPEEYVILSAHFDSWDGASGATDNGTGSLAMMEAMRILKKYSPAPKRTILAGLWGSEEQGLNGSRAFVADHPEIVENLQALFNQDNGTGRIVSINAQGFLDAPEFLARWISRLPGELTSEIRYGFPGVPWGGGSDHAPFVAAGVPGISLGSLSWDYGAYTWHTNRDTYDKIVFEDLRRNVILIASLAYLAADDPQTMARDRRIMPVDERTGQPRPWPETRDAQRRGGLQ